MEQFLSTQPTFVVEDTPNPQNCWSIYHLSSCKNRLNSLKQVCDRYTFPHNFQVDTERMVIQEVIGSYSSVFYLCSPSLSGGFINKTISCPYNAHMIP